MDYFSRFSYLEKFMNKEQNAKNVSKAKFITLVLMSFTLFTMLIFQSTYENNDHKVLLQTIELMGNNGCGI